MLLRIVVDFFYFWISFTFKVLLWSVTFYNITDVFHLRSILMSWHYEKVWIHLFHIAEIVWVVCSFQFGEYISAFAKRFVRLICESWIFLQESNWSPAVYFLPEDNSTERRVFVVTSISSYSALVKIHNSKSDTILAVVLNAVFIKENISIPGN